MQVISVRPQPSLEYDVTAVDGAPHRLLVLTGTVDVVPPDHGRRFRVLTSDPAGTPLSFGVGDARPVPRTGATLVAEAWVSRMRVSTSAEDTLTYGISDVVAALAPIEGDLDHGLPHVRCRIFGGDLTMTLTYRLSVMTPRSGWVTSG